MVASLVIARYKSGSRVLLVRRIFTQSCPGIMLSSRNRGFYTRMKKFIYFAREGVHPRTHVRGFGTSLLRLSWHLIAPSVRAAHAACTFAWSAAPPRSCPVRTAAHLPLVLLVRRIVTQSCPGIMSSIRNRVFYTRMKKLIYFALAGVHPQKRRISNQVWSN